MCQFVNFNWSQYGVHPKMPTFLMRPARTTGGCQHAGHASVVTPNTTAPQTHNTTATRLPTDPSLFLVYNPTDASRHYTQETNPGSAPSLSLCMHSQLVMHKILSRMLHLPAFSVCVCVCLFISAQSVL